MQGDDLTTNAGRARRSRHVPGSLVSSALASSPLEAFRRDSAFGGAFVPARRSPNAEAFSGLSPLLIRRPSGSPKARILPSDSPLGGRTKRLVDVLVALSALIVLAPMMLFLAALIRVTTGSNPIFAHERMGFGGRSFRCYKFRTMRPESDEILKRHLASNPQAADEWKRTRKLMNDPRINCLGNVLRKSSIDELPQLINVLKGDMSLVGPRPVVASELELYGRRAKHYFASRPGITGLWQVSGRSRVGYSTRVAMDSLYVRSWSPWLDAEILLKTIPAVTKFDQTA